jgi:hypothetical protein
MIEGMLAVVPGMNVKVEAVVSSSLNKAEKDLRYCEPCQEAGPSIVVMTLCLR